MAKNNKWHYLVNQFDNATKGTYKKADILFADHYAKLDAHKSDTDILPLFNRLKTVKEVWDGIYSDWIAADAKYSGETDRVEEMLAELSGAKISQWDAKVQAVFLEKTPDYVIIFPKGRAPYQTGTYERILAETDSLGGRLDKYSDLAALATEVKAFAVQLNDARDAQQSEESLLSKASTTLEAQRVIVCNIMYANLGRLIDKFYTEPQNITNYFQLSLLRTKKGGEEKVSPSEPPTPPLPPEKK